MHDWQDVYLATLGHRLVFAADEYYLLADRPFPEPDTYEGFAMHEDGIGMARTFELEFSGQVDAPTGVQPGFFAWVDGAPAEGYRAPRTAPARPGSVTLRPSRNAPVGILTGPLGAQVLEPLVARARPRRRAGHPRGQRVLRRQHRRHRPDGRRGPGPRAGRRSPRATATCCPTSACRRAASSTALAPEDLPRPVEIVATDGLALRAALDPTGARRPTLDPAGAL